MYKEAKKKPYHTILNFIILIFELYVVPLHPQNHGKVLYGMLLVNPPGLDRSKGSRS